jgi:hypothetical protein
MLSWCHNISTCTTRDDLVRLVTDVDVEVMISTCLVRPSTELKKKINNGDTIHAVQKLLASVIIE